MSGVSRLGEESVLGRGASSAKTLKRQSRAQGPGRLPCLEPGELAEIRGVDGAWFTETR